MNVIDIITGTGNSNGSACDTLSGMEMRSVWTIQTS